MTTIAGSGTQPLATPYSAPRSRWSRKVAADLVAIADMAAVILGGIIPATLYARWSGVGLDGFLVVQSSAIAALIVHLFLHNLGLYDTRQMHAFPDSPVALFTALLIGILAMLGLSLPRAIDSIHIWVWYAAWLSASFTFILLVRMIAGRILARAAAEGRFEQTIAVFGAGTIAQRVKDHLSDSTLGIRFAGVFDDRADPDRLAGESPAIAGRLDDLVAAARRDEIDQIIVALPQTANHRLAHVARKLEQLPVSIHIVTHLASDIVDTVAAHKVSSLGPIGLMDVKPKPLADWEPFLKSVEDYVLGFLFFLAVLPLFPIIALAIKLDTPGPVLFRQSRRGLNRTVFDVLKFRTMTVLEDGRSARQATSNDPRVTRVGRILRRTSLDELPQIWNVLRGEMSLVGPRPHALVHDDEFSVRLEEYAARHQVKPGITGLAQVNGWRGETETTDKLQARIDHDIAYIRNWSLWLDLKILMRTAMAVVTGRNAN